MIPPHDTDVVGSLADRYERVRESTPLPRRMGRVRSVPMEFLRELFHHHIVFRDGIVPWGVFQVADSSAIELRVVGPGLPERCAIDDKYFTALDTHNVTLNDVLAEGKEGE